MTRAGWTENRAWPPDGAPVPGAEALPWEQQPLHGGAEQDGWLLSFIDMLTLLLALFVLLLAHQQQTGETPEASAPTAPTAVAAAPAPAAAQAGAPAEATGAIDLTADARSTAEPVSGGRGPEPEPELAPPAWRGPDYFDLPQALFVDAAVLQPLQMSATRSAEPAAPPADDGLLADLEESGLAALVEMQPRPGGVDLEIRDSVLFAPASADLTPGGLALLDQLAGALRDRPHRLSVEGHTDDRPISTARYPSNWELSMARAARVTRHLIGRGIAPERVRAIGYADTRPRAANDSDEGRARNRRVSFLLRQSAD